MIVALAFIAGLLFGAAAMGWTTTFLKQRRVELGIDRFTDEAGA